MEEENMSPSTKITRLLTDRDVAVLTGLARSTLAKLRVTGGGPPYVKIGAAVRYPDDSLTIWIAAQRRRISTADGDAVHN